MTSETSIAMASGPDVISVFRTSRYSEYYSCSSFSHPQFEFISRIPNILTGFHKKMYGAVCQGTLFSPLRCLGSVAPFLCQCKST